MDFDFTKGGEDLGRYYPALKPVPAAIKFASDTAFSTFYHYEPGNGTRYEVLFNTYKTPWGRTTVMTLVNFRKCMIISGEMGMQSLGYMMEKLGINEGDCYALIPLVNTYLEELGS